MRTRVIVVIAAIAVCLPALAEIGHGGGYGGGQAYWNQLYSHSMANGGEFTLTHDGPGTHFHLGNNNYAAVARGRDGNSDSFQTFCVEKSENIFWNETVDTFVSEENWGPNGSEGPGSHAWRGSSDYGDNLNPQTAYLYYMFAKGQLANSGYDYDISGGHRRASANSLQQAIWFIESEQDTLADTQAIAWVNEAIDKTGVAIDGWSHEPQGRATWGNRIGLVRVVQLYAFNGLDGGTLRQDQLWVIPAPGAVLLGALGWSLVSAIRRRMT